MTLLVQYTIIFAAVLSLTALGGCFSEHSGVINLGLEGIMVMGGLGGALAMDLLAETTPAALEVLAVFGMAVLFGVLYSILLAAACINFKADQTLVGTALNLIATALAVIIVRTYNSSIDSQNVSSILTYVEPKKKLLIHIGNMEFTWFMVGALIALIVAYIVLYKSKFGLRLRSCGENPQAAASVGIDVYKMRWAGVLISGMLGGLGGAAYITSGVSQWKFEVGVAGFGFLALAVMIFGQWKPHRIALTALLFGFFRALSNVYMGIGFLQALNIPGTVYNMLPYIISLIVLAFTSENSAAPKDEGVPYDQGKR